MIGNTRIESEALIDHRDFTSNIDTRLVGSNNSIISHSDFGLLQAA